MKEKITVLTEIITDSDFLHPYDAEAWDMWGRVRDCHHRLFDKYSEEYGDYMNAWDCYDAFCQECEQHDKCFQHSEWFKELIEG